MTHGLPLHCRQAGGEEKELRAVDEGAAIPSTTIKVQANLIKLHKRGRMLVASYESVRYRKLDLFSVTLRQIGSHIARCCWPTAWTY